MDAYGYIEVELRPGISSAAELILKNDLFFGIS